MRVARQADDSDVVTFTNPEQHVQVAFAKDHVTVQGRDEARVAFTRARLGREGAFVALSEGPVDGVGTGEVTIARSAGDVAVTEWWRNRADGVEQGFTVATRPAGDGVLEVEQPWVSALTAEAAPDDSGVTFADAGGQVRLQFGGVRAWDARGRALSAHMRVASAAATLTLVVNDADAVYPITIDPIWSQQAYLKASNTEGLDFFGWSIAVSGDTIVVGAQREMSSATGVNGDQTNNNLGGAGAAYVFVRAGTTWTQQAYLKASNTGPVDLFGYSVEISGDTLVVGAPGECSAATGVNGNQADNSACNSGAVYVFVRTGTTWTQQAYLKASNTGASDGFGTSLAVSGDTLVVGAYNEASAATGVNGNQADNSLFDAGAAYVFVRAGTTWTQQAYLKASNPGFDDEFGTSVAVSGDTIVVGAPGEQSTATGVNGNQANNDILSAGAAYVFVRAGTTWTQQAYLKASNTFSGDFFGQGVATSGDTVVVGAFKEDGYATGVNGDQYAKSGGSDAGAAYVFVRVGTTWTQQAYVKASNPDPGDYFGLSVSVSGDTLVVGAHFEDGAGVNGIQANNSVGGAGAAYVFVRAGTTWTQQAYLKASNPREQAVFGYDVAVSGDTVVVGAWGEPSSATGVNGNQASLSAYRSGAAYVFHVTPGEAPAEPTPRVDLNGDGNGDAFVYKPTTGSWRRETTASGGGFVGINGGWSPGWTVKPAQFNNDLLTDFFVFSTTTGQWFKMLNNGAGGFTAQSDGGWWPGWQRYVMDLDGDGISDLFLYDPVTGQWYKCISTPTGFTYFAGGWSPGWQPYPWKLNVDAREDLFLINPTTGQWVWVQSESGGNFTYPVWGAWAPGWNIYPADFDGDGRSDMLLHNPAIGQYYLATNFGTHFQYRFGSWALGWTPYIVDLDGNQIADLFLYHSSGQWFELLNQPGYDFTFVGTGGWSPNWEIHPTDFNGDGRTDLLLYSPTTGQDYQAWNFNVGAFSYFSGVWDTGLTIILGKPMR